MTNTIQACILLHDFLYANLSLIPANSLDGKDKPKTVFIITESPIIEAEATDFHIYDTAEIAMEMLAEQA